MVGTRKYFLNATIPDDTAAEYAMEWADLVKQYGMERFEEGLALARRYRMTKEGSTVPREFFPMPSDIEQFITTRTTSPVHAVTDLDCADCKGTGWKYTQSAKQHRETVRCHCRRLVAR